MKIARSSEQWRALILQQQESGLSVAAFCREQELAPSSFYSSRRVEQSRGDTQKLAL